MRTATKAWAIKNPFGKIGTLAISNTKQEAIAKYSGRYSPWRNSYRRGFRAVKIIIREA